MKNFYLTIWTVILVFLLAMGTVTVVAFRRSSTSTGIDPAKIQQLREVAKSNAS